MSTHNVHNHKNTNKVCNRPDVITSDIRYSTTKSQNPKHFGNKISSVVPDVPNAMHANNHEKEESSGFIGVIRKRNRINSYHLRGIANNCTENYIRQHMATSNVHILDGRISDQVLETRLAQVATA